MILFKACPRCYTGDVEVERDVFGWRALCLQCGYVRDLDKPQEAELVLSRQSREREPVAQSV